MDYWVLSRHGGRERGTMELTKVSVPKFLVCCFSSSVEVCSSVDWNEKICGCLNVHTSFAVIFPFGLHKCLLVRVWRKQMSCLFSPRVRFLGPSNHYRCCAEFCGFLVQGRWSILGSNLLSAIAWLQFRHANPSVILTHHHHHHRHHIFDFWCFELNDGILVYIWN